MPTVREAAEALEVKPATVRAWILARKISFRKIGRSVRIPKEEVDRILREGLVPSRRTLA